MGNVRLSYFKNPSGSAEVLEKNDYYPFGLKHDTNVISFANSSYNYQYNGKELQKETGWSDFGARMYMSDIGRWGVIDPLAETSRKFNPYNYALNNPVMFIDPDGRKASMAEGMETDQPLNGAWGYYAGGRDATSLEDYTGSFTVKLAGANSGRGSSESSSPTFQFPKGQEEYYQKNYPAFYNLVKNILPNILKDTNFLKALMDVTGMSEETLKKAFAYGGDSPIIHANNVIGDGYYDYSGSFAMEDLNTLSVDIVKVLNWYEKANKDPNTINGVANIFYMTAVVGHEVAHWGNQIKGPKGEGWNFLCNFKNLDGEPEHGEAFEFKLFNSLYPKAVVGNGILHIGHANSSLSKYIYNYASKNFQLLSDIFKSH